MLSRRRIPVLHRGEAPILEAEDFTSVPVAPWAANQDYVMFGWRTMGSSNGTDFSGFSGKVFHINGATVGGNRPNSGIIVFPGGSVSVMATGDVYLYKFPAKKIRVTPVLIDSFGGDGDVAITVTKQQVITGRGVTYNRQSEFSTVGAISDIRGSDALVYGWSTGFHQLPPGQYTFANYYITWHYSQYVLYYLIFEF